MKYCQVKRNLLLTSLVIEADSCELFSKTFKRTVMNKSLYTGSLRVRGSLLNLHPWSAYKRGVGWPGKQ